MLRTSSSRLLRLARRSRTRARNASLATARVQCAPLHVSVRACSPAAVVAEASISSNCNSSSSTTTSAHHSTALLAKLDECIAKRECTQALATLQQLETQTPSTTSLQKLIVLLAKQQTNAAHTQRAFELLLSVYRAPGFTPDDYTTLASIHVVDACLRHNRLDDAVALFERAFNQHVLLDLAAYDALLHALVAADRTLEAVAVLNDVADDDAIAPPEQLYQHVLLALVQMRAYEQATALLERGHGRGVVFTAETFEPLIACAEQDEDPTDALVLLLTFIEDTWEDAQLFDALSDAIDAIDEDDDDDNDDSMDDRTNEH